MKTKQFKEMFFRIGTSDSIAFLEDVMAHGPGNVLNEHFTPKQDSDAKQAAHLRLAFLNKQE